MTPGRDAGSGTRLARACARSLSAAVLLGSAWAAARGAEEPPSGLPAGPWILKPSLTAGYALNTNVFYQSAESVPAPVSDYERHVTPAVMATLPFRNSSFTLAFDASRLDYKDTYLNQHWSYDGAADLALVFSSADRLSLRAKRTLGIAETMAFDPGGEYRFQGAGFDLATYEVEAGRAVLGHRGYRARIAWSSLSFDPGANPDFFEFRGYETQVSYREPVSQRTWIVGDYEGRHFDHYYANVGGEPYRLERTDMLRVGVEGKLGEHQPYFVLAGWGQFRFPGSPGSDYNGWVLEANLTTELGPSTTLLFNLSRRPWPSFYEPNNYYLVEGASAKIERRWLDRLSAGAELAFQSSSYPEPTPPEAGETQARPPRYDRTARVALYANLMILEEFGFRVSIEESRRTSNIRMQDYRGGVYFAGIVLGWI
jgi:hypothetical protein